MNIIDRALSLLKDGAKKVEFEWEGKAISAYWAGTIIRIDIKGVNK